jgi:hypothetical protein
MIPESIIEDLSQVIESIEQKHSGSHIEAVVEL